MSIKCVVASSGIRHFVKRLRVNKEYGARRLLKLSFHYKRLIGERHWSGSVSVGIYRCLLVIQTTADINKLRDLLSWSLSLARHCSKHVMLLIRCLCSGSTVVGVVRSTSILRRWNLGDSSGVPYTSQRSSGMRTQLGSTRRILNYSSLYTVCLVFSDISL